MNSEKATRRTDKQKIHKAENLGWINRYRHMCVNAVSIFHFLISRLSSIPLHYNKRSACIVVHIFNKVFHKTGYTHADQPPHLFLTVRYWSYFCLDNAPCTHSIRLDGEKNPKTD